MVLSDPVVLILLFVSISCSVLAVYTLFVHWIVPDYLVRPR